MRALHYLWIFVFVGLLLVSMVSCSDEDDVAYPPLVSEFVTVLTDASGTPSRLRTDDGSVHTIVNASEVVAEGLTPDSLYRAISRYERTGEGVQLYALQPVISTYAVPAKNLLQEIGNDPVGMQSVWVSGGYLNVILQVKMQNGKHSYYFVEDSLVQTDGGRKLCLSLSHDAGDDVLAYTQNVYLSVPLSPYKECLVRGDRVELSIPTMGGRRWWTREYLPFEY